MPKWNVVYCDQPHPIAPEIAALSNDFDLIRLPADASRDEGLSILRTAHIFHNPNPPWRLDREVLEQCPELLFTSPDGAGYDNIDVSECTDRGVCVANQSGLNSGTVAEFAVSVMLAHAHRLLPADRAMRRDRNWTRLSFTGSDLRGSTLGIVGFGNIGSRVGDICRNGFEMNVLAYDPFVSEERIRARGAEPTTLERVLSDSDVVTVHMPLSKDTQGIIGRRELERMKHDALLITTARGGVVDENALYEVLRSGHLSGAGVDVWLEEPPRIDNPLLALDNVLATPHIAGSTRQGYRAVTVAAAEQIVSVFNGEKPSRIINPNVWPKFLERLHKSIKGPLLTETS
jgi:D-3-phosphoglycerate dehydrogenase